MDSILRCVIFLLCFFEGILKSACQECLVEGTITDAESGLPISGVNISDRAKEYKVVSEYDGKYELLLPMNKNIELIISHVGYRARSQIVNCRKARIVLNIELSPSATQLEGVMVLAQSRMITNRGDTIIYRLNKQDADATLGDALNKVPGFRYENGQLEINGERVSQLLLDGEDFFKGDVGMTLKNLKANIVEHVEVYDKNSDYGELTGFDDGNSHRVVNVKTKKGVDLSAFGKVYGGYGTDNRYQLYGMYNFFKEDLRYSIFMQCNNINEQNFSTIDLLSATGTASSSAPAQSPYSKNSVDNSFHPTASDDESSMMIGVSKDGITTSKAAGVNYIDSLFGNKMKLSGHYLFNSSRNVTDYDVVDEYYETDVSASTQRQSIDANNINHRLNLKYEYHIGKNDYLLIRPSITYQRKTEGGQQTAWAFREIMNEMLFNQNTETFQNVISNSDEIMYLHKLTDKGHSLSFDGRFSYIKTTEDIDIVSENTKDVRKFRQKTESDNCQKTYSGLMSYVQPLGKKCALKFDVGWCMTDGQIRRHTGVKSDEAPEEKTDPLLSGITFSEFGGFLGNVSYMYSHSGLNVVVGSEYHGYLFRTRNEKSESKHRYNTPLPFFVLRWQMKNKQIHIRYRAQQKFPGLMQVQRAVNNVNATMLIEGNPYLEAAYHHNVMLRFVVTDLDHNGSIGVLFANVEQASNYIAQKRMVLKGREWLSYRNADGYLSTSVLIAYGFPVSVIKSNLNVSTMMIYTNTPGFWNETLTFNREWCWNSSFTVGSNINEKIDFIIDTNCKYIQSENIRYNTNNVKYWSLSYGGQINWYIIPALKVTMECGNTNYYGSGTSRFNAFICNASVAWKFMKDRRGELKISCNDIFNNNNNFSETTNELYRRVVTTNVLKRYGMLTFTYNINRKLGQNEKH